MYSRAWQPDSEGPPIALKMGRGREQHAIGCLLASEHQKSDLVLNARGTNTGGHSYIFFAAEPKLYRHDPLQYNKRKHTSWVQFESCKKSLEYGEMDAGEPRERTIRLLKHACGSRARPVCPFRARSAVATRDGATQGEENAEKRLRHRGPQTAGGLDGSPVMVVPLNSSWPAAVRSCERIPRP